MTRSKISTSSAKFFFSCRWKKSSFLLWPLICWDIFDFSSATAERNSMKLDMKQVLIVFYPICVVFGGPSKNKGNCPGISVSKGGTLNSGARYMPLWVHCFQSNDDPFYNRFSEQTSYNRFICFQKMCRRGLSVYCSRVVFKSSQKEYSVQNYYYNMYERRISNCSAIQKNLAFWLEITIQIQMWITVYVIAFDLVGRECRISWVTCHE